MCFAYILIVLSGLTQVLNVWRGRKRKIKSKDDAKGLGLSSWEAGVIGKAAGGAGSGDRGWEFTSAFAEFGMTVSYLGGAMSTIESRICKCEVGEEELDWTYTFLSVWH